MLRPGGVYVQNVIDYPPFRFARAEVATLRTQFDWVAAIGPQSIFDGSYGGNIVLVASNRQLDGKELARSSRSCTATRCSRANGWTASSRTRR